MVGSNRLLKIKLDITLHAPNSVLIFPNETKAVSLAIEDNEALIRLIRSEELSSYKSTIQEAISDIRKITKTTDTDSMDISSLIPIFFLLAFWSTR